MKYLIYLLLLFSLFGNVSYGELPVPEKDRQWSQHWIFSRHSWGIFPCNHRAPCAPIGYTKASVKAAQGSDLDWQTKSVVYPWGKETPIPLDFGEAITAIEYGEGYEYSENGTKRLKGRYFVMRCNEGYYRVGDTELGFTCRKEQYYLSELTKPHDSSGCTLEGNPCNLATGNKLQTEVDYQAVAPNRLDFIRYYNSAPKDISPTLFPNVNSLSSGWRHHYSRQLELHYTIKRPMLNKVSSVYIRGYDSPDEACRSLAETAPVMPNWNYAIPPADRHLSAVSYDNENRLCSLTVRNSPVGYARIYKRGFYGDELLLPDKLSPIIRLTVANGNSYFFDRDKNWQELYQRDVSLFFDQAKAQYIFTTENNNKEYYRAADGLLTQIDYLDGYQVFLHYNGGLLSQVRDGYGNTLAFSYNAAGKLTGVNTADGQLHYGYGAGGGLSRVTFADGNSKQYRYSGRLLTGIIDETGSLSAKWSYQDDKVVSSEHAGGSDKIEINYKRSWVTVDDVLGAQRTYYFTSSARGHKRPVSVSGDRCDRCVDGEIQSYRYDDKTGFLQRTTDRSGRITDYTRNRRGLPTRISEAVGTQLERTTDIIWHSDYRLPLSITRGPLQILFHYDAQGRLVSVTRIDSRSGASRTTSYAYTATGLLSLVDGPRTDINDITRYTYTAKGYLSTITNALGQAIRYEQHDKSGRPRRLIDVNGLTTDLRYNARGWLIELTRGDAKTAFTYLANGQLKTVVFPNGYKVVYSYDKTPRLSSITDSMGESISYQRDLMGNVTQTTQSNGSGQITFHQTALFDRLGQLSQLRIGNSTEINLLYNALGQLSRTTQSQHRTDYLYDRLSRLTTVRAVGSNGEQYSYDILDQITKATDDSVISTLFSNDALGNTTSVNSVNTGIETLDYDAAGNVIRRVDGLGQESRYRYDALNRLLEDSNSDADIRYRYDNCGQAAQQQGRLCGITDTSGEQQFLYYPEGDLSEVIWHSANMDKPLRTAYAYDINQSVIQVTYPSGNSLLLQRNPKGRVTRLQWQSAQGRRTIADNISYLPDGRVSVLFYGNGIHMSKRYDTAYRLTRNYHSGIQDLLYQYDENDNISSINDSLNSSRKQHFSYDGKSRLTKAAGWYGERSYQYTPVGSLKNKIIRSPDGETNYITAGYQYVSIWPHSSHQLVRLYSTETPSLRRYDALGNAVLIDGMQLFYGADNRLQSVLTAGGKSIGYAYNAQGQRTRKTVDGVSTYYLYDQSGLLIAETDVDGRAFKEYIYLNGEPLAFVEDNELFFIHGDHLGTPQYVTDSEKSIVWQAKYYPYGEVELPATNQVTLNLRFAGQYHDVSTGLYHNYHRDYDPSIGQYIQADPIGLNGGMGLYLYANDNPIMFVDPLGLASVEYYLRKWVCGSDSWESAFSKAYKEKYGPFDPKDPMDDDNRTAAEHYIFMRLMVSTESGIGTSISFGYLGPYWAYGYQALKQLGIKTSGSPASYSQLYWENKAWTDSWGLTNIFSGKPGDCGCGK